jgi:hypothetical protein
MYHREANESVAQYIANGALDSQPISIKLAALGQATPEKIGTPRRINANIDALERFLEMLDDINLMGAQPQLGSNNAPRGDRGYLPRPWTGLA